MEKKNTTVRIVTYFFSFWSWFNLIYEISKFYSYFWHTNFRIYVNHNEKKMTRDRGEETRSCHMQITSTILTYTHNIWQDSNTTSSPYANVLTGISETAFYFRDYIPNVFRKRGDRKLESSSLNSQIFSSVSSLGNIGPQWIWNYHLQIEYIKNNKIRQNGKRIFAISKKIAITMKGFIINTLLSRSSRICSF